MSLSAFYRGKLHSALFLEVVQTSGSRHAALPRESSGFVGHFLAAETSVALRAFSVKHDFMSIQLAPELEAQVLGLLGKYGCHTPEEVIRAALRRLDESRSLIPAENQLSFAEFQELLATLPFEEPTPGLPADFTRADLYDDHD